MNRPGDQRVRRLLRLSGLAAGSAVLCTGSPTPAQDIQRETRDSIVVSSREELPGLRFENWRALLEITARREVDEVDPDDGASERDREDRLEERFILETEGFYIHPNLLEFRLSGGVRLRQEWIDDADVEEERNDEVFGEFDANLLFLRRSDNPITLFARRTQNVVNRQFGSSLDSTLTEYGAQVRFRWEDAPTLFQLSRREQDQSGGGDAVEYDLAQNTFLWQTQLRLADRQRLTWDYTFDDIDESGSVRPNERYQRHDAVAVHTWEFGEDRSLPSRLRSEVRYYKETGAFATDRFRWDESLDLFHTANFQTRYDYTFEHLERAEQEQQTQRASAGLRHQLFESLLTNADVGVSRFELKDTDFTSDEIFGGVDFDYTKAVPLGELNAGLAMRLSRREDSEQGAPVQVIDQARTFSNGRIVFTRRNFLPATLVITDLSGLILYVEGIDYNVTVIGDVVEIGRILGGAIAPGETVLLDYQIGPDPANTTDTFTYGVNARYDIFEGPLTGLGVYVRYVDQSQEIDVERGQALTPDDVQTLIYGAEYRVWRLYFQAEQENRDSTLSPFDATRLEARYFDRISPTNALLLSAHYDRLEFGDVDRTSEILTLDGRWNTALTDTLRLDLYAAWRDERNSGSQDLQAWEQELGLTWEYRQTSVFATIRNVMREGDTSDTTFQTFFVGLRREF
jgi:hypothetical protein